MFSVFSIWSYFKLYVPYSNALLKTIFEKDFSSKKVD